MNKGINNLKISGIVVSGKSRGRLLGFPTANILPCAEQILPEKNGVYHTKVTLDGETFDAITNIGTNPTFGANQRTVENHIFDFDADITGKKIEVEIIKFIRDEKKFKSAEELVKQIESDVKRIRGD